MEQLQSALNSLHFELRKNLLGRIRLRRGLPNLDHNDDRKSEGTLYNLLLDSALGEERNSSHFNQIWDIGCRNWSYATALAVSFPNAELIAVEVDAWRRYWNFYRRLDFIEAEAAQLRKEGRSVSVFAADFREVTPGSKQISENSLLCFFFPFVSNNPCLKWGLPLRFADFSSLVGHALMSSKGQPTFLSCHQGEWEAEEARMVYQHYGIRNRETRISPSSLPTGWPRSIPIHLFSDLP